MSRAVVGSWTSNNLCINNEATGDLWMIVSPSIMFLNHDVRLFEFNSVTNPGYFWNTDNLLIIKLLSMMLNFVLHHCFTTWFLKLVPGYISFGFGRKSALIFGCITLFIKTATYNIQLESKNNSDKEESRQQGHINSSDQRSVLQMSGLLL